ncbi:MAG TPA: permease-like cell division protein FtsX [Acidimicrobiia bacterium]|jgi:cell division transport system permease protein
MWSRFKYFARETLISLRRNLLMTVAGVLTVTVSLFILGGALLSSYLVDHGTQRWKNGISLEIFLQPHATEQQQKEIRSQLSNDTLVRSYKYVSQEDAYKDFKRWEPVLASFSSPSDLPVSFRVAPKNAAQTMTIADKYQVVSGVSRVVTADKTIKNLLSLTSKLKLLFVALFLALLVAALFLIVNTIRLATFARRREIEVMKLVGASNWFIRVPFMLEGLVQGLIGGAFALAGVWALRIVITNTVDPSSDLWRGWYISGRDGAVVGFLVLALGAGIGALGSVLGLRRFLEA